MSDVLTERRRKYDIPSLPYLPMGKNVLVFRLPEETKTAGGLYVPETAQQYKHEGILIGAGLAALDIMVHHLIEIGDVIWFGRFAGWDEEVARDAAGKGRRIVQMKLEDILGSVDALDRVNGYNIERNQYDEHVYVKRAA